MKSAAQASIISTVIGTSLLPVTMVAGGDKLVGSINRALEQAQDAGKLRAGHEGAMQQLARLTLREREVMEFALDGVSSKNIAADLGISWRAVESHRASVMKKTGPKFLPALARLALAAAPTGA